MVSLLSLNSSYILIVHGTPPIVKARKTSKNNGLGICSAKPLKSFNNYFQDFSQNFGISAIILVTFFVTFV